jgi:hypothetical protein
VAAKTDLTAGKSYDTLVNYAAPGRPSLAEHVRRDYAAGYSTAGAGPGQTSALLWMLDHRAGHCGVELDDEARHRLTLWMDTYAQKLGSFSVEQEQHLLRFRDRIAGMLAQDPPGPK